MIVCYAAGRVFFSKDAAGAVTGYSPARLGCVQASGERLSSYRTLSTTVIGSVRTAPSLANSGVRSLTIRFRLIVNTVSNHLGLQMGST